MDQRTSKIWEQVVAAAAYAAAARAMVWAGAQSSVEAPIWPASGVALGLLLVRGPRLWPGVLAGALVAGAWDSWSSGAHWWAAVSSGLSRGAGESAAAIAGAWLIRRFAAGKDVLERPLSIFRLGVIVTGCSLVLGTGGAQLAERISTLGSGAVFGSTWLMKWLASTTGTVVVAPVMVAWGRPLQNRLSPRKLAEAAALILVLGMICLVLFGHYFHVRNRPLPVAFLVVPVLLWVAVRFGQRGTTAATLMLAGAATLGTLAGHGPFALEPRQASLMLQSYLIVAELMTLGLAADMRLREHMEIQLRASEQRYRDLFEYNPQPMWLFEYGSLKILAANRAALQDYGYTQGEVLSMGLPDLWPESERPKLLQMTAEARNGLEMRCDCHHVRKDGSVLNVNVTSRNLIFDGRQAAMVLSEDVTERKRAEKQTAAFSDLARRLGAVSNAKEAARLVMGAADSLFGWDACMFQMCIPGETGLVTVLEVDTIEGKRVDATAPMRLDQPGIHTLQALKEGARLILRPEPATFAPDMQPFGDTSRPSASLMFAPVRAEDEAIAVISVQSYRHHAYSESDLALFQALADHCGSALKRVRAEDEVRRLNSELEYRVSQRTAQLESINKELEAFSYSVSHDLRAPLRSIRGFSEVLLERYHDGLDQRGQEFLQRVCQSSQQMDRLIEDLLKLSRVGRSELQQQDVDLSALAEAVLAELENGEPNHRVQATVTPGLHTQGDERLLRIVLENLLRNSWKFSAKKPSPRIEFGFTDHPERAFFVRDNGAGFDMAYASKLFGVFQRLHSVNEFPGTGVGLATVQRIIGRHGGRIWAEAKPDEGAAFYFTLPAQNEM